MPPENFTQPLPFKGKSCWTTVYNEFSNDSSVTDTLRFIGILKVGWIIFIMLSVIVLNLIMITVLHSRHYAKYIGEKSRILMTSLACTDLAVGIFVIPFSVYPSLYDCWPFGEFLCAFEALLIAALFHQSCLSLAIIAVDRYICINFPLRYHQIVTRKLCLLTVVTSWIVSFTVYSLLIYPTSSYHFDASGLMNCEPNYAQKPIILIVVILFYFPPMTAVVFCYSKIFCVTRKQIKKLRPPSLDVTDIRKGDNVVIKTRKRARFASKIKFHRSVATLGGVTFGFSLAVTPWTLTELISSCLEVDPPSSLHFCVSWIAVSNSFLNPIIYGMLSKSFRKIALRILRKLFRRKKNSVGKDRITYSAL